MIPSNQGSILFQDSSLNRTPRENYCILGFDGSNENFKDVPNREHTVHSMVKVSEHDDETKTHGRMYTFAMRNSP